MQLHSPPDNIDHVDAISARTKNMRDVLEKGRIECGIPGMSVAVLHKGKVVFAEGFGKRNDEDPFTPETVMPIASCSKAFTATAIGELVADGKMDWDTTPVSKYLPEFKLKDPVLTSQLTLVDLLSHHTPLPNIGLAWFRNTESRRDLIKGLENVEMDSKLSSKCNYSNVMYAVAGEAAANVAGISYEKVVETRIFGPLGLTHTGFSPMEMKKHANYAMPYDALSLEDAQKGIYQKGHLDDIYMVDAPAGDVHSTVLDMVKWGQAVMNLGMVDGKQVLNKKSVEETLTGQTILPKRRRSSEFAPEEVYAMGWTLDTYKGQTVYRHNGALPGYRTELNIFPNADLVIAQFANLNVADLLMQSQNYIADEILDLPRTQEWVPKVAVESTRTRFNFFAKEAKGEFPERIKNKPMTHDLESFVGEYKHIIFGKVSISLQQEKEGLYMKMRTIEGKLEHYHFDSFAASIKDFVIKFAGLVTFVTGESGEVTGLKVKFDEDVLEFEKQKDGTKNREE